MIIHKNSNMFSPKRNCKVIKKTAKPQIMLKAALKNSRPQLSYLEISITMYDIVYLLNNHFQG